MTHRPIAPIENHGFTPRALPMDLSVAHDSHGKAAEEQHKTRGCEADETSGNAVEATHDTSFRPKDHVWDKLIKTFGIWLGAPQ